MPIDCQSSRADAVSLAQYAARSIPSSLTLVGVGTGVFLGLPAGGPLLAGSPYASQFWMSRIVYRDIEGVSCTASAPVHGALTLDRLSALDLHLV